jgi:hypothetical protein
MEQEVSNPSLDREEIRGELEKILPAESMPGDEAAWEALLLNLETGSVEELLARLPSFELMDDVLGMLNKRKLRFRTFSQEFAIEYLAKPLARKSALSRVTRISAEDVP